jgi:hypothetical protein
MADPDDDFYPCVGICMADPDSGYCLGCGRPPLESPAVVAEAVAVNPVRKPDNDSPDTPE